MRLLAYLHPAMAAIPVNHENYFSNRFEQSSIITRVTLP